MKGTRPPTTTKSVEYQRVSPHKRPHSALGYLTPMEFQRTNLS